MGDPGQMPIAEGRASSSLHLCFTVAAYLVEDLPSSHEELTADPSRISPLNGGRLESGEDVYLEWVADHLEFELTVHPPTLRLAPVEPSGLVLDCEVGCADCDRDEVRQQLIEECLFLIEGRWGCAIEFGLPHWLRLDVDSEPLPPEIALSLKPLPRQGASTS